MEVSGTLSSFIFLKGENYMLNGLISAKIELKQEECYCGIPEFYDMIAKKIGCSLGQKQTSRIVPILLIFKGASLRRCRNEYV